MTGPPVDACPECGASGRFGSCQQLFQALVALASQGDASELVFENCRRCLIQ